MIYERTLDNFVITTQKSANGCADCRKIFSGLRNFDRHRRKGQCLSPEDLGLRLNKNGFWGDPKSKSFYTGGE